MNIRTLSVLLALILFPATSHAQKSGWPKTQAEYSATRTMETEEISMGGKTWMAKDKQRDEMDMGGMKSVTIIRRDKKVMWNLMPSERMYMEHSLDAPESRKEDPENHKIEWTEIGEETLNGLKTTKSKVIMTRADGKKMGGFMWVSKEGIVVRIDALTKSDDGKTLRFRQELTDIRIGPQSADLFEIPAGYTKMAGFPGMGGMSPGGMKTGPGAGDGTPKKSGRGDGSGGGTGKGQKGGDSGAPGGLPPGFENLPPNVQQMIREQMKNAGGE